MKDKIIGALGGFGAILWYLLTFVLAFAPLLFLGLPWWVDIIAIAVIVFVPMIGEIVRLGLYIWAFIVVLQGPIDVLAIIFFVCFAIYVAGILIPLIVSLFKKD